MNVSTTILERTATLTELDEDILNDLDESTDDGKGDGLAHYVHQDDIIAATFQGKVVFALCGKRWVPNRNPEGLPVCARCQAVHDDPSNFLPEDGDTP